MTLIEKLEAATGPDRELDVQIYNAIHGTDYYHQELGILGPIITSRSTGSTTNASIIPEFTGSMDAAMMLAPKGWTFELRPDYARLLHPKYRKKDCEGFGANTALAICIAAIRARGA